MLNEQLLLRTWSLDAMYSPGAQSDELITFLPKGVGFFEDLNWGYGSVLEFTWSLVDGMLRVQFRREFETDPDGMLDYIGELSEVYETSDASIRTAAFRSREGLVLSLPGFSARIGGCANEDSFGWHSSSMGAGSYVFPPADAQAGV